MLVVDVDRLIELNDRFGHLVGAEAVRTVGHIIAATLPDGAVACRYGGDEFAIALPNSTEVQAAQEAERLRADVGNAAPVLGGKRWPAATLSVSVGIACLYPGEPAPAGDSSQFLERKGEDLFRAADRALYQAKASGRNCVWMSDGSNVSAARR
jgi:diguanylate cyclase (GGDEF)-like protein